MHTCVQLSAKARRRSRVPWCCSYWSCEPLNMGSENQTLTLCKEHQEFLTVEPSLPKHNFYGEKKKRKKYSF